jgi:hypothetical protein
VEAKTYAACMDVVDSDHKPVCALFDVTLPHLAPAASRRLAAALLQGVPSPSRGGGLRLPLSLSVDSLTLHQVFFHTLGNPLQREMNRAAAWAP